MKKKKEKLLSKVIHDNKHYEVVIIPDALGDNGQYEREGYGIINKETGVIEITTTVLPQAIFSADGLSDSMTALQENPKQLSLVEMPTEDVVPN